MVELKPDDYIGISFWLISIALFATTVFLVIERFSKGKMENTYNCCRYGNWYCNSALLLYETCLGNQTILFPIVYRYIDWFLTVPLQIIEFYLILAVANRIKFRLLYFINY